MRRKKTMTKESWNQYQNAYRKKNYTQLAAYLDPTLVFNFKEKLKKDKKGYTEFLKEKIKEYLEEK